MIDNIYTKLAGAALIAFAVWYATSDHYQKRIAEIQLQTAQAVQAQLLEDQNKIKLAGEQHAKDQLRNNALNRQLAGLQVHGICSGTSPDNQSANGSAGVLSERVDAAFAKLQEGVTGLLSRCDQLNIDAIASNNSQ